VFSWNSLTVASSSVRSFFGGVTTKADAGPTSPRNREKERDREARVKNREPEAEERRELRFGGRRGRSGENLGHVRWKESGGNGAGEDLGDGVVGDG
jgi:hypothetical protein